MTVNPIIIDPTQQYPPEPEIISNTRLTVWTRETGALLRAQFSARTLAFNLAPDPSFEYGTGGFSSGTNGTVEVDPTVSRSGGQSIKLTTTTDDIFNPSVQIYTDDLATNPEPRLLAGDTVTAQVWTYVPDLLPPLSEWNGGPTVNGTPQIITDPTAPERPEMVMEWTAARDQVNNSPLVTSTPAPATADSTLSGSIYFKKGNPQAPGELRLLILCYDASDAYLGSATGGNLSNIAIGADEWTPFTFTGVQPLSGTASVRIGIYPDFLDQDSYSTGDKIRIVAPELIPQGDPRPQLRIGGSDITGTNTPDFTGPYNTWTPLTLTRTINADDSTMVVYLYASAFPGRKVWFDDLSVTVNGEPVDFTGDTSSSQDAGLGSATAALTGVRPFEHQPERHYEAWPELTETPAGAWMLSYNSTTGHVLPSISVLQRSTDQGETWQQVRTFGAANEDWGGGQIAVLHDGSMIMFTSRNTDLTEQSAVDERIVYRSTDDGLTWTERARISPGRNGPMGEVVQLAGGDILAAHSGQGWGHFRSSDAGLTWSYVGTANGGPWMSEARIVQCPDNSLVAIGRAGDLLYYRSTDEGLTWTQGINTAITEGFTETGNSNTEAIWLTGHRLEMVWIARPSRQMLYTYADVRDLVDDPTAWAPSVEIGGIGASRNGDLGYPALVRRTDGDLHAVWYADPDEEGTPSIHEGVLAVEYFPGEGEHYRWRGQPGSSPSEQYVGGVPGVYRVRFLRDGEPVRSGNTRRAPGGIAYAFDLEAPYGQDVSWTAQALSYDGTVLAESDPVGAKLDATYVDCENMWLKSITQPDLSAKVNLTEPLPQLAYEASGELSQILGSTYPAGAWEPQQAFTTSITLVTRGQDEYDTLLALLRSGLLLAQPESSLHLPDFYFSPGSLTAQPEGSLTTGIFTWTVPITRIDRPRTDGAPLFIPGLSYARILNTYPDYDTLRTSYTSYGDILEQVQPSRSVLPFSLPARL